MKVTKNQLKKIIKEELNYILREQEEEITFSDEEKEMLRKFYLEKYTDLKKVFTQMRKTFHQLPPEYQEEIEKANQHLFHRDKAHQTSIKNSIDLFIKEIDNEGLSQSDLEDIKNDAMVYLNSKEAQKLIYPHLP